MTTLRTALTLYAALSVFACAREEAKYPGYCYDSRAFTTAILLCTDKSSTREQSKQCKHEVNSACGFVDTGDSQ